MSLITKQTVYLVFHNLNGRTKKSSKVSKQQIFEKSLYTIGRKTTVQKKIACWALTGLC